MDADCSHAQGLRQASLLTQVAQDEVHLVGVASSEHFAQTAFAILFTHKVALAVGISHKTGEVVGHTRLNLYLHCELGLGFLTRLVRVVRMVQLGNKVSRFIGNEGVISYSRTSSVSAA